MSSANVLPTAPPESDENCYSTTVQQSTQLYPSLPAQPDNFRLQKINEIATTLNHEVEHYRLVAKKYKKVQTAINWTASGAGFLSTLFSSASLGSALTGIGLTAAVPLGGIAGVFALSSAAMVGASKKIESKISKHQETVTLAVAKRDTVERLMSQAIKDQKVSDAEFNIILDELARYKELKDAVRSKVTRKSSKRQTDPKPDLEKIKKEIRNEVRQEFTKKLAASSTNLN